VPDNAPDPAPPGGATQASISAEIAAIAARPARTGAGPLLDYPPYRSSVLRHPGFAPVQVDPEEVERAGPVFGARDVDPADADLTAQHPGEPLGERMVVAGRITDGSGRPVAGQLVEVWQANASGRYAHARDRHPAPLDPNFTGTGRCLTDAEGRYRFVTVKPGPYPWRNHRNAWRPAHIHFSLFGHDFTERVVTQMYFPGDPLLELDPTFGSIPDGAGRDLLLARYDHELTSPEWSTGYRWDIVLTGTRRTWTES
jgi:protocatechuate 3,4-dioxygenase, beta subunit